VIRSRSAFASTLILVTFALAHGCSVRCADDFGARRAVVTLQVATSATCRPENTSARTAAGFLSFHGSDARPICGAALLGPRLGLTAGHCVSRRPLWFCRDRDTCLRVDRVEAARSDCSGRHDIAWFRLREAAGGPYGRIVDRLHPFYDADVVAFERDATRTCSPARTHVFPPHVGIARVRGYGFRAGASGSPILLAEGRAPRLLTGVLSGGYDFGNLLPRPGVSPAIYFTPVDRRALCDPTTFDEPPPICSVAEPLEEPP